MWDLRHRLLSLVLLRQRSLCNNTVQSPCLVALVLALELNVEGCLLPASMPRAGTLAGQSFQFQERPLFLRRNTDLPLQPFRKQAFSRSAHTVQVDLGSCQRHRCWKHIWRRTGWRASARGLAGEDARLVPERLACCMCSRRSHGSCLGLPCVLGHQPLGWSPSSSRSCCNMPAPLDCLPLRLVTGMEPEQLLAIPLVTASGAAAAGERWCAGLPAIPTSLPCGPRTPPTTHIVGNSPAQ